MRYKKDRLYELTRYLSRLEPREVERLHSYIDPKGRKGAISVMLHQLIASGSKPEILQKLTQFPDHNHIFSKLKKRLEEFKLTEMSVMYLKKQDSHKYAQVELQKRILTAQIQFDQGLALNAIDLLDNLLAVARRNEFLGQELKILRMLQRFHQIIGNNKEYLANKVSIFEVKRKMERFEKLANLFNEIAHRQLCCDHHKCELDRDSLFPFQMTYKSTRLIKVKWMQKYLRAELMRQEKKYDNGQKLAWELLNEYKENEVIFSRHYYLILMQFILENMYYLNKIHVVHRASKYMHVLDEFGIYQSIHLHYLYLYEQFRLGRPQSILEATNKLRQDLSINSYTHILQHLAVFDIHAYFQQKEYKYCLREINTCGYLNQIHCCRLKIDLKVLEILCLMMNEDIICASNRMEALRKYIARNKKYEGIKLYKELFTILNKWVNGKVEITQLVSPLYNLSEINRPIYSFEPYAFKFLVDSKNLNELS